MQSRCAEVVQRWCRGAEVQRWSNGVCVKVLVQRCRGDAKVLRCRCRGGEVQRQRCRCRGGEVQRQR